MRQSIERDQHKNKLACSLPRSKSNRKCVVVYKKKNFTLAVGQLNRKRNWSKNLADLDQIQSLIYSICRHIQVDNTLPTSSVSMRPNFVEVLSEIFHDQSWKCSIRQSLVFKVARVFTAFPENLTTTSFGFKNLFHKIFWNSSAKLLFCCISKAMEVDPDRKSG